MSIRLLIVDDQELVRVGFRLFLETQEDLEVVGESGDGETAVARARTLRPDVVSMSSTEARRCSRRPSPAA